MKKTIITLAALVSLGLTTLLPFTASAQDIGRDYQNFPGGREEEYRPRARYEVYYRRTDGHRWRLEGSYRHRDEAEHIVRRLERRGYIARIERIEHHRNRTW